MERGVQGQRNMANPQPQYDNKCESSTSWNNGETSRQRPLDLRLMPSNLPTGSPTAVAKFASKRGSLGGVNNSSNTSSPFEEFHAKHAGRRRSTFDLSNHKGSCHCGSIKFELRSRPRVKSLLQCTCTACLKYRDLCLYLKSDKIKLIAGQEKLTSYTYGAGKVTVKFCSVCGVKCFKIIERAPLKLANVLIAIGGAHAPFEESEDLESPGPSQSMGSFIMRRDEEHISSITTTITSTEDTTDSISATAGCPPPYSTCSEPQSASSSSEAPSHSKTTTATTTTTTTTTTKSLIGLNICSCIEGNTISYDNILTCDLTSVSWAELKQLLCS